MTRDWFESRRTKLLATLGPAGPASGGGAAAGSAGAVSKPAEKVRRAREVLFSAFGCGSPRPGHVVSPRTLGAVWGGVKGLTSDYSAPRGPRDPQVWFCPLTRKSFSNERTYLEHTRTKKYADAVRRSGEPAPEPVVREKRRAEAEPSAAERKQLQRQRASELRARDRAADGEEEEEEDEDDDGEGWETASDEEEEEAGPSTAAGAGPSSAAAEWDVRRCLFSNHLSENLEANLEHMYKHFGFYVPDAQARASRNAGPTAHVKALLEAPPLSRCSLILRSLPLRTNHSSSAPSLFLASPAALVRPRGASQVPGSQALAGAPHFALGCSPPVSFGGAPLPNLLPSPCLAARRLMKPSPFRMTCAGAHSAVRDRADRAAARALPQHARRAAAHG